MTLELKLLAALLLVASLFGGGFWLSHRLEEGAKATAALKVSEAARAEEQRRAEAQSEIAHDAKLSRDRADAQLRLAGDSARRLQQRYDALVAQGATAPAGSASAAEARDMLAELRRGVEEAARSTVEFADRASVAGDACQRSYDALTTSHP